MKGRRDQKGFNLETLDRVFPRDAGERANRFVVFAFYALLFALCVVVYHGIYDNNMFNDDYIWLRAARQEMNLHNVTTLRVVKFFRPLINRSFSVMERLSPGNIPLYHKFNLTFHVLNTILIFHLVVLLLRSRWVAAATAILFSISSYHTGAVFWISARTTLVSIFFALASMTVLFSDIKNKVLQCTFASALYALALLAKETAVTVMPIVLFLFMMGRGNKSRRNTSVAALVSLAGVSAVYLVMRSIVLAGVVHRDWGLGVHALRNLAGSFIFQFYPFDLFVILWKRAIYIPESSHPFWPEILAVPLIVLLIWAGIRTRKRHEFIVGIGWTLLALLPQSFFRYRFFSTSSITQVRYYYLSSAGALLIITLLISILWNKRSRIRQALSVCLFVLLCTGSILWVDRLEKKWADFTLFNRQVVQSVVKAIDTYTGPDTVAIEECPLAFPYIADAIALERPRMKTVEVRGGKAMARAYKPCLYVWYTETYPKLMYVDVIE